MQDRKIIIAGLAKKSGANVLSVNDEQFEDFALGSMMDTIKKNENVRRESIMRK